ncbi:RDD family protein [Streptomyces sp. NPDC058319]|uniref:RDD family protein n=1 Tax=unclassified Streptomyces TaxID=2593676 RepID=UPI0036E6DA43
MAWLIDFALVVAAASALAVLTFHRIAALVTDVPELATRGGLDLLGSRGDVVGSSEHLGLSLWNKAVLYVEQGFALLVLATFLYQWACLALAGRTAGKALLGLKVAPLSPLSRRGRSAAVRAAVTTAADVAVYAVACVLLIEGHFLLSVLVWAVAVLLFLVNALPVLFRGRRSLADRLARTSVTGLWLGAPGAPLRTAADLATAPDAPVGPAFPPPADPGYPPAADPGYPPVAAPGFPAPGGGQGLPRPGGGPGFPSPAAPGFPPPGGGPGFPPPPGPGFPASGTGFSTPGATPPARTS